MSIELRVNGKQAVPVEGWLDTDSEMNLRQIAYLAAAGNHICVSIQLDRADEPHICTAAGALEALFNEIKTRAEWLRDLEDDRNLNGGAEPRRPASSVKEG
jgi:hypothetical protein